MDNIKKGQIYKDEKQNKGLKFKVIDTAGEKFKAITLIDYNTSDKLYKKGHKFTGHKEIIQKLCRLISSPSTIKKL